MMGKFLFQGHGSFRIITDECVVIYVDPYAGSGYDVPADIILVTHQHHDHNQISKVIKKENCQVIQNFDALQDGKYQIFTIGDIKIEAVPAYNKNHRQSECVGYILTFDGIKLYAAGDTSTTSSMNTFSKLHLDYALLPIDGIYNMDPLEATKCADLINARHSIPIHMKPGLLFDMDCALKFKAKTRLIVKAGEEINLEGENHENY